eukprot:2478343-Prymnesium_polylepis.1
MPSCHRPSRVPQPHPPPPPACAAGHAPTCCTSQSPPLHAPRSAVHCPTAQPSGCTAPQSVRVAGRSATHAASQSYQARRARLPTAHDAQRRRMAPEIAPFASW